MASRRSGVVVRLSSLSVAFLTASCAAGGQGVATGAPPEPPAAEPASRNLPPEAPAAPAVAAGIFTRSQAERGRTAFDESCADCHTTGEFRGRAFQRNWGRRTVYSLYRTVRSTMPDDNPGGLDEGTYLDVIAYVLSLNGHEVGAAELAADSPMRDVRIAPTGDAR